MHGTHVSLAVEVACAWLALDHSQDPLVIALILECEHNALLCVVCKEV